MGSYPYIADTYIVIYDTKNELVGRGIAENVTVWPVGTDLIGKGLYVYVNNTN